MSNPKNEEHKNKNLTEEQMEAIEEWASSLKKELNDFLVRNGISRSQKGGG